MNLGFVNSQDHHAVRRAFQTLQSNLGYGSSPTFAGLTLTGATATRLVQTNASKGLASVANLANWIAGVANETDVTDDGDGTITVGLVNPLIVGKGGTGAATLTDHGLLLGSGTDAITPLGVATNGQLPIGSTGVDPVLATLTGTANQITVTNAAGSITLSLPQDIATASSPQFARVYLDSVNTYLDTDGSNNLTFTDAVTGTRTLKNVGCPVYHYIKVTGQAEGDLHLSDDTNWAVSKVLIKYVRVITNSSNWDLYILQNDNGFVADDATIPKMKIANGIIGNANLWLDLPYQDEDASNEVHLYYLDNSGANTATIIIKATELV